MTIDKKTNKELSQSEKAIFEFKKESDRLFLFTQKIQIESIVNELIAFLKPGDFRKKNDLLDYICSGKLGSKENNDLENIADYMIYGSTGHTESSIESRGTRKLKYILDNYGKDVNTILIEIKDKEKEHLPRTISKPKVEKEEGISKWIPDRLKDAYNYGVEKLSDLRNFITESLPTQVKEWVKTNLFSPEKQKNTENINEIYKQLKGPEKPDFFPFYLAMQGYNKEKGKLGNSRYLTVVDYSKPVNKNRLYVINMQTLTVENCVQTGHGKNSGDTQKTTKFSNEKGSNKTSIGFFRTPKETTPNSKYRATKGKQGWKGLFLKGMEYSNDHANTNNPETSRGIAMHPVGSFFYGSNKNGHKKGESTSEGCITILTKDKPGEIMAKIKGDSLIYSYYPDMEYLNKSTMIS